MSEKITVPSLGESVTEATVSKWLKSQGDKVIADEPVVELETDKVNVEVPAPMNGFLGSIAVKEGETVNVGSLLGTISNNTKQENTPKEIKTYSPPKKDKSKNIKLFEEKKQKKIQKKINEAQIDESEEDFVTRCALELEELILAEGPDSVAALFAEPVMGAGGVIIPPAGYFEKIRSVLEKYDVLLVADEVICGFGRTGNMWGSQTMDVRPDILTCAKALSSAYLPISAVMISDKIYAPLAEQAEKLGIFGHGYTYSAHPVCAAVALRAQKLMQERDIIGHVRSVTPISVSYTHLTLPTNREV